MKQLTALLKKLQIGRILTVAVVGLALCLTTACNSGNLQGARPDNLPVQAGGNNNPHKGAGDNSSEYKMTTDPSATRTPKGSQDRASLPFSFNQLIADSGVKSDASNMLYPGVDAKSTDTPDIGPRGQENFTKQARQIPAQRQPLVDRSDPDTKILEKTGEAFKDASQFVRDTFEDVQENPADYQMRNPALGK